MKKLALLAWSWFLLSALNGYSQTAYFVDGYHGGIYGHYPATFTQYIVDALGKNPDWKLNLEIEPETWDWARTNTPEAFQAFQAAEADQSVDGRIEFVNPCYGQSYLWNISGECIVQQLSRGMRTIHRQFPNAQFVTYSSEEPCFTSCLPEILRSLGFKFAVLKNPNTCWGGYTRAFGKEIVNWIGPDGTSIRTVPRYDIEALKSNSTWETIAAANSVSYVQAARADGIDQPAGMCFQDAGWRFGPWLSRQKGAYEPTRYVTWRQYFETISQAAPAPDWRLSQEDVRVSLVWGSQVLQKIAQEVRRAENRTMVAEKLATMATCYRGATWPQAELDEAWRTLMLSQHHDCWIVPYNRHGSLTWAEHVAQWTGSSCKTDDEIVARSTSAFAQGTNHGSRLFARIFNTVAEPRNEVAAVDVPGDWNGRVLDRNGREVVSQIVEGGDGRQVLFAAQTPALGCSICQLENSPAARRAGAKVTTNKFVRLETDYYTLELDPAHGGVIRGLIAKKLGKKDFVDGTGVESFNEIRGQFLNAHKFLSTADAPARIRVLESGPVRVSVAIESEIDSNAVTQWITLCQGQPRIDCRLRIDWHGNPKIGADGAQGKFQATDDRKAFYDDRAKLRLLFPLALREPRIFKNAPFDVTESRLTNTFFDRWSEIKNNIILKWVDAYDSRDHLGLGLFTDHTTSYSYGPSGRLGLTVQYSGVGLWGRDYSLRGPSDIRYALEPHRGNWQEADLWSASERWNEPLLAAVFRSDDFSADKEWSFLTIDGGGWSVPTMRAEHGAVVVRLFNPSSEREEKTIHYNGQARQIELVQLDGTLVRELALALDSDGRVKFKMRLPPFGMATLQITP